MPRGIDHIVHAVRDLDAAADGYRRLGFTVGAENRHSWGTHNQLVQLPGFFIELLTVAEPDKLGSDGFSSLFGRFNQSFLTRHEGLDRSLYAGLVNLVGEQHVELAMALRCALVRGREARIFAGAGLVEGLCADLELGET